VRVLQGLAASPGIAIGPAFRLERAPVRYQRTAAADRERELLRFQQAVEVAARQLEEVHARAAAESGASQAAIFEAQALMLQDPELLQKVRAAVEEEGIGAEAAVSDAAEEYIGILEALDDDYLRARSRDVRDVADRLLRALLGVSDSASAGLQTPSIIVARDLTPSDTVALDKSLVLGFCTAEGGTTSHTAILARALALPAVVGLGPGILEIEDGTPLALDAGAGTVWVEPDAGTVAHCRAQRAAVAAFMLQAQGRAMEPAVTRDGHRVEVMANVGDVEGAWAALLAGAEGIGLLRSEFLYLERPTMPGEEEQYQAYRRILEVLDGRPVTLRTLDVGGDKGLHYIQMPPQMNPSLGLRGIRLCLARPDIFRPQLRAALRAGAGHSLRVMFPMVSTLGEVRAAREMLESCRNELRAEGHPVADQMEVGVMVEVPAAALMADRLAAEVDFFSIGTNDLSQYVMAADRTSAEVAHLADAFHPAVLRLVRDVIAAAHTRGRRVGLCGELAGEPLAIPVLLGLGLDELSISPPRVPLAKQVIRALTIAEARDIAAQALALDSPEEIQARVRERVAGAGIQ